MCRRVAKGGRVLETGCRIDSATVGMWCAEWDVDHFPVSQCNVAVPGSWRFDGRGASCAVTVCNLALCGPSAVLVRKR